VLSGSAVTWSIVVNVGSAANFGLAGVSVDLVQEPSNPQQFDILAASGVPSTMAGFSRPAGISNPGQGGAGSGYGGTQVGVAGSKNLQQIGGAQNICGVSGGSIGQDLQVDAGVGHQTGGQLIASGSFAAPCTRGTYVVSLSNGFATVLLSVGSGSPPAPSLVSAADVALGSSISFTVVDGCDSADFDGDGDTGTDLDIEAFFACIGGNCCLMCGDADFNNDCDVGNDTDIEAFFRILGGQPC